MNATKNNDIHINNMEKLSKFSATNNNHHQYTNTNTNNTNNTNTITTNHNNTNTHNGGEGLVGIRTGLGIKSTPYVSEYSWKPRGVLIAHMKEHVQCINQLAVSQVCELVCVCMDMCTCMYRYVYV